MNFFNCLKFKMVLIELLWKMCLFCMALAIQGIRAAGFKCAQSKEHCTKYLDAFSKAALIRAF